MKKNRPVKGKKGKRSQPEEKIKKMLRKKSGIQQDGFFADHPNTLLPEEYMPKKLVI